MFFRTRSVPVREGLPKWVAGRTEMGGSPPRGTGVPSHEVVGRVRNRNVAKDGRAESGFWIIQRCLIPIVKSFRPHPSSGLPPNSLFQTKDPEKIYRERRMESMMSVFRIGSGSFCADFFIHDTHVGCVFRTSDHADCSNSGVFSLR